MVIDRRYNHLTRKPLTLPRKKRALMKLRVLAKPSTGAIVIVHSKRNAKVAFGWACLSREVG